MDYSQILKNAYQQFILSLGGKKIPTPYRINIPYQDDRRKYGKSRPAELVKDTTEIAQEQNFDLEKATIVEIRTFMEKNLLGIDCSGFVYHLLDNLLKNIGRDGMEKIGFPKASKTNVALLTSIEFSVPVADFSLVKPGDLIKLNSQEEIPHILIVLSAKNGIITYAHSSFLTRIKGAHQDQIKNGQFPEDLRVFNFNIKVGDGIYRLKVLK